MKRRQWMHLPAVVEDLLETWYGRWFTIGNLVDLVVDMRPEADRESVQRAITRVLAEPKIELERRQQGPRRELRCPERAYLG